MTRCRSCNAPIEWGVTTKGYRIPLDPGLHDDGNLMTTPAGFTVATTERPAQRAHFASCPNAGEHRKKRA